MTTTPQMTVNTRWRRILAIGWVTLRMKIERRLNLDKWRCVFGRHDWEPSPAVDVKGNYDSTRPGRHFRCARPSCRVLRGPVALLQVGHWLESPDFMVILDTNCKRCFGRGYTGLMNLGDGMQAKRPCACLRVQPAYIQAAVHDPRLARKLRREIGEAVMAAGR